MMLTKNVYVPKSELGSPNPPCISNPDKYLLTTRKSTIHFKAEHGLDVLHLRPIKSTLLDVPVCHPVYGINHQCPGEMLHAHGNGIIEYQLEICVQMVGPNKSKTKQKMK